MHATRDFFPESGRVGYFLHALRTFLLRMQGFRCYRQKTVYPFLLLAFSRHHTLGKHPINIHDAFDVKRKKQLLHRHNLRHNIDAIAKMAVLCKECVFTGVSAYSTTKKSNLPLQAHTE